MRLGLLFLFLCISDVWAKWSVSTFNLRNFDQDRAGPTDLEELKKILRKDSSDVFAFEEIVNVNLFKQYIKTVLPQYGVRISSCGGSGRQKLAVVYKATTFKFIGEKEVMEFSSGTQKCGTLRPLFLVTLQHLKSQELYIFGVVHLKAGGQSQAMKQRWKQYRQLATLAHSFQNQNLILLGDFNTTGFNQFDEDYTQFMRFLAKPQLVTLSEELECTSYWKGESEDPEFSPSLLDHVVIQDKNLSKVDSVKLGTHCGKLECRPALPYDLGRSFQSVSDHCPVKVTFKH